MQSKSLIFLLSIVSILTIALLAMPHLIERLAFLAKFSWYNGVLAIIFIFSSVSLWVTYKYNAERSS